MAKLNSYSRIISNDYDGDNQPLIEKLGAQINDGFSPLYSALSNRLTFEDNFLCTVREVEVTVGADGIPLTRTSFSLSNNLPVKGTLVVGLTNKTNAASYPTASPFVSYSQNANLLFIDNITGLVPNNRYIVKIIAIN